MAGAFLSVVGCWIIRKGDSDGICAHGTDGILVRCIAVALAEILNTFPILFRRLYINRGLSGVMIAMALGKMAGSFYYFFFGYGLPKYW